VESEEAKVAARGNSKIFSNTKKSIMRLSKFCSGKFKNLLKQLKWKYEKAKKRSQGNSKIFSNRF